MALQNTINGILLGQDYAYQNSILYYNLTITSQTGWKQNQVTGYYTYNIKQEQHGCGRNIMVQFYEYDKDYNGYKLAIGFPQENGIQIIYDDKGDITLISNNALYGRLVVIGNNNSGNKWGIEPQEASEGVNVNGQI